MIELWRDHVDFEHEGEMFRLSGDLSDGFVAWLSWTERLTTGGEAIPLSEQEQMRVMYLVRDNWNENDKCSICFISDNYDVLCDTRM